MADMTRVEAIEMLKSMKYEDDETCSENQALDIAIASLTIDEKYDLEFARSEEQIKACGKIGKMSKYRKKPIVVEAFQLNSRGLVAEDWFWDAVSRNEITTYYFGKFHPEDAYCDIKTLEGTMRAYTGDYIIRGVNGEIYPCKPDIFEKTYEKVEVEE